jgi:hypothetical protein
MKRSVCVLFALGPAMLQAQFSDRALAIFPDGTEVEIYSAATGSTQLSAQGLIGLGQVNKQNLVNRVVVDRDNNGLFAYNLEASHGASPDAVIIRIDPLNPGIEADMLKWYASNPHLPRFSGSHIPTVAAVREFPNVKIGEVITLDILVNPSTGEKIYDVLLPLLGPPGHFEVTSAKREEISLRDITVKVNNRVVSASAPWMAGPAMRIDIPGHGVYVIGIHEPHLPPIYSFTAAGRADGKIARWRIDGDMVEVTSSTNVLTQTPSGVLWIYHDGHFRSKDQPKTVKLQTADSVDWLIPKK